MLRRLGACGNASLAQPDQLGGIIHHQPARLGAGEQLLHESGLQGGELCVQVAEHRLVGIGKLCAGADETLMDDREQLLLVGIQPQTRTLVVNLLNAGEQRRVEVNRIAMRR